MADTSAGKAAAAAAALELVEDGMRLGLGTGSTAAIFVDLLIERVRGGLRVSGLPTSNATAAQAAAGGIPLLERLDGLLDLAVDGADEIDPDLNLVKGRGGALVREKLVAAAARRFVVIGDASKLVERLGAGALPVEVLPFLWEQTAARLEGLGLRPALRGGSEPFLSDNGNLVLDCSAPGGVGDPSELARVLKGLAGVVDHGLFVGMADLVLVGEEGGVRELQRG